MSARTAYGVAGTERPEGKNMKFRPLHDRVVVRRVEPEGRRRAGSSFRKLPRKSRRKAKSSPSARGGVTERKLIPIDVKAGDRIC